MQIANIAWNEHLRGEMSANWLLIGYWWLAAPDVNGMLTVVEGSKLKKYPRLIEMYLRLTTRRKHHLSLADGQAAITYETGMSGLDDWPIRWPFPKFYRLHDYWCFIDARFGTDYSLDINFRKNDIYFIAISTAPKSQNIIKNDF